MQHFYTPLRFHTPHGNVSSCSMIINGANKAAALADRVEHGLLRRGARTVLIFALKEPRRFAKWQMIISILSTLLIPFDKLSF